VRATASQGFLRAATAAVRAGGGEGFRGFRFGVRPADAWTEARLREQTLQDLPFVEDVAEGVAEAIEDVDLLVPLQDLLRQILDLALERRGDHHRLRRSASRI
jgi:hypothetical protein